jgi:hypothetical protein
MKVENRVTFDNICDYIPIASTFNSIVDLWQKHAYIKDLKPGADKKFWDDYQVKIINKSTVRSVVLLVPVLGNICVGIYDLLKSCFAQKVNPLDICTKTDAEIDAFIEKYRIFGKKHWEALGFFLGPVSPPPDLLEHHLDHSNNEGSPFFNKDVYLGVILVPSKVNGEELTYERFCNSYAKAFNTRHVLIIRDLLKAGPTLEGQSPWRYFSIPLKQNQ